MVIVVKMMLNARIPANQYVEQIILVNPVDVLEKNQVSATIVIPPQVNGIKGLVVVHPIPNVHQVGPVIMHIVRHRIHVVIIISAMRHVVKNKVRNGVLDQVLV